MRYKFNWLIKNDLHYKLKINFKKIASVIVLIGTLVICLSGCSTYENFKDAFFSRADHKNEIAIGVIEPLSGNNEAMGVLELRGVEVAHKLRPEIAGKKVKLMIADNQSSVYAAEAAAKDLVARKAVAVIGSYGDAVTLAASEVFKEAKLPAIACSTSNPLIINKKHYYFTLNSGDYWDGQASGRFFTEALNLNKVALIVKDDTSKKELVDGFNSYFKGKNGNDSVVTITIDNSTDYRKLVEGLYNSGVKAVFAPIPPENARQLIEAVGYFIKEGDALKGNSDESKNDTAFVNEAEKEKTEAVGLFAKNLTILGDSMWYSPEMEAVSKNNPKVNIVVPGDYNVKDTVIETALPVENEAEHTQLKSQMSRLREEFDKEYEKLYNQKPTIESARAFDAYNIILDALEDSGGLSKEDLVKSILKINMKVGLTGPIKFSDKGEAIKPIKFYFIKDGQYKPAFVVSENN